MKKANVSGVYIIRNTVNDKRYIGSSKSVYYRWKQQHYSQLRRGVHANTHLQNAWNKHGADQFEFVVIEECVESALSKRESYWIEHFKSWDRKHGYNLNRIIDERQVRSEETIEKIRRGLRALYKDPEYVSKRSEIMKQTWHQKRDEIITKLKAKWSTDETKSKHADSDTQEVRRLKSEGAKRYWATQAREVLQLTLDGQLVKEWRRPSDAIAVFGRHVSSVLNGKRKNCGGFLWRYKLQ